MTILTNVWRRLRTTFGVRRQTVAGPLLDAFWLRAVLRRIEHRAREIRILAPEEFAPYIRGLTALSPFRDLPDDLAFDCVILRQDHVNMLDARLLATLRHSYVCTYANRRFALFAPPPAPAASTPAVIAMRERLDTLADAPARVVRRLHDGSSNDRAILVTTFNRCTALRRMLPQVAALGCYVLVVDDGSDPQIAETNRLICDDVRARYLRLPENRGLSAALNIGLSYLLADRRTRWISYFQDDVDVDPALMHRMRLVEDPVARPIVTGYDADDHPAVREEQIAGVTVKLKRSSPALHLHAHVDYWIGVLPIPTEYLGAPRRRWESSLEDYWIVNHAPNAAGCRGLLVPCVPGLVRTFLWHHTDSTWGNPNLPDPPLSSARTGPT